MKAVDSWPASCFARILIVLHTLLRGAVLWTTLAVSLGSCAPLLVGPGDQNSALVMGRVVVDNKFPGNFYGLLPQGIIEKGLELEVESREGNEILKVTTGENGFFLIPNISQKSYYLRRVSFEGARSGQRERRSQEVRRLNFTPVPGRVLYVGSLFIDLSERGFATYREVREDERARAYLFQTFGTSPWTSRAFVTLGASGSGAQVLEETATQSTANKLTTSKFDRPEWKPGYQWRYAWKSPGRNGTLTREIVREETFGDVAAYVMRVGKNESFYTKEVIGLLGTRAGGKITLRRDAPYQPLSWPLQVGREWKNSYILERLEEKSSQRYDHRILVSKVETVQVPAGTHEALKIEVYDAYSGSLLNEYWYSPQVKWFVRTKTYEQNGVREEELLSYKIG
jgi:hypothetical protein